MTRKSILILLMFGLIYQAYANKGNILQTIDETMALSTHQLMGLYKQMAEIPDRLPRTINANGKLVTSNAAWWTSGFFPGSLWYLYEYTGNEDIRKAALTMTERIRKQQFAANDHDIGFIIFCSFGNALRLTGNEEFESVVINGAKSLSTRFRDNIGVIKSWNNKKWQYPVIIDNMMNLEILTQATKISGDSSFCKIAISHADKTMKYHFRDDASSYHVVSYDTINGGAVERVTHQGANDESAWARGQAWGLYGYVMMYRETGKKAYLDHAISIADYIAGHKNLPEDKIPYWDFNAPDLPNSLRDASAGAIMASAFVELSTFTDKKLSKKYYSLGKQMVRSLASPAYLANKGENGHFVLKHSVGHMGRNSEVDVPLTYADYYFLEAMIRIKRIENVQVK
ncbi:MAG: glycoside hydrolase family 88 protein [Paludibacter sp.]|nr:glycoside hydrolase family 88 protein [Paludibacter sp.]